MAMRFQRNTNGTSDIGRVVYKVYQGSSPLIILENINDQVVKVMDLHGRAYTIRIDYLQDFNALVEDHRRKYENQSALVSALRTQAAGYSDPK